MNNYIIRTARPNEAEIIASLIMEAMNHDCCQWFAGPNHTLSDFHQLMTELVKRTDSQYSYLNTSVAVISSQVVGVCVTYDGAKLHELRHAFIEGALRMFGMDHSSMGDETQAGELYLDSLAVLPEYRCKGIAKRLLKATKVRANQMNIPCVGLLVDKGNPIGEALYTSVGFRYMNDSSWGGHPMKHLIL